MARYFLNTFLLVTLVLAGQFIITTLAGFAFAKVEFPGKDIVFILVLMQLFILPEVLIVENYVMVSRLGLFDTILGRRHALHGQRLRHLPDAPGLQVACRSSCTRRRGSRDAAGWGSC